MFLVDEDHQLKLNYFLIIHKELFLLLKLQYDEYLYFYDNQ